MPLSNQAPRSATLRPSEAPAHARALRVLVIKDRREGHYHLSYGIVSAIETLTPVAAAHCEVQRRLPGRIAATMVGMGLPPPLLLRTIYGLDAGTLPACDIVVSSGAETLAANIAAARMFRARNVFYGSLRAFKASDFSLVLTSYAADVQHPNQHMVLKPSALTLTPRQDRGRLDDPERPPVGALLLGGDSGESRFTDTDWTAIADLMLGLSRERSIRWVVSNSRRTPSAVSDRFAALAATLPDVVIDFVDVRTTGPGTIGRVLDPADFVLCTDDSSSMISEAIGVGLRVVGLKPQSQTLTEHEANYRHYLEGLGGYCSVDLRNSAPHHLIKILNLINPVASHKDPCLLTALEAFLVF